MLPHSQGRGCVSTGSRPGLCQGPGREVSMGEQESGRESQGQEGAAHTSSRGCPAGVRDAHRLGLTFCSLLANTAASEHLLLRFSSSHGLQASL